LKEQLNTSKVLNVYHATHTHKLALLRLRPLIITRINAAEAEAEAIEAETTSEAEAEVEAVAVAKAEAEVEAEANMIPNQGP
jgi:hypothetical protein